MQPSLEAANVSKYFFDRAGEPRRVLDNISLTVQTGEFVAIVGASGCGKTTFIRCAAGLIPIEEGSIKIDGKLVTGPATNRGFVFQHDSLLPWRNVLRNILFGPEARRDKPQVMEALGASLLKLVGLSGYEHHFPHELSGGMRQRVNLARALAIDPAVLLMDEPFAALDAQTREIMQAELLQVCVESKKTVLFITHQIEEALYLADRVVVFSSQPGRIVADVAVPFARPRELSRKRTPEFLDLVDHIWRLIERDVVAAIRRPASMSA